MKVSRPKTDASVRVTQAELDPLSAIRADDVDVYLRVKSFEEKVQAKNMKALQRLKFLALEDRFDMFEQSVRKF